MQADPMKWLYHKLAPETLRKLVSKLRQGEVMFPLSSVSRKEFQRLTRYYPRYHPGTLYKAVGFYMILNMIKKHSVVGDIVECGVGIGESLIVLGMCDRQCKLGRRLYGYDSFQGFPEPSKYDVSVRNPQKGDLWGDTSLDHVRQNFIDAGLSDFSKEQVNLIQGFFDETLLRASDPDTIAFLHLDVDLYDSYKICAEVLGPRVTGLIQYDEYNSPKWPGATRAINECLLKLDHTLFFSSNVRLGSCMYRNESTTITPYQGAKKFSANAKNT